MPRWAQFVNIVMFQSGFKFSEVISQCTIIQIHVAHPYFCRHLKKSNGQLDTHDYQHNYLNGLIVRLLYEVPTNVPN